MRCHGVIRNLKAFRRGQERWRCGTCVDPAARLILLLPFNYVSYIGFVFKLFCQLKALLAKEAEVGRTKKASSFVTGERQREKPQPREGTHCISHCNSFCFCFRVTLSQQLFVVDVGRGIGWAKWI